MLFWNRYKVITGIGAIAFCLMGCSALRPIFTPKATATDAMGIVATAVESTNLWWPIMFAGFLALLAGIVNLVFLRGGAKLLVIGVLLALTPPVAQAVVVSLTPWIAVVVAIAGLGLLGIVLGRWFGRRDIVKQVKDREAYILASAPSKFSKKEVGNILKHVGDIDFNPQYKVK